MLLHCKIFENCFKLRTVSDHTPCTVMSDMRSHIMASHKKLPHIWSFFTREAFKCSCFACSCDTKQCKTLSKFKPKTQIVHSILTDDITLR